MKRLLACLLLLCLLPLAALSESTLVYLHDGEEIIPLYNAPAGTMIAIAFPDMPLRKTGETYAPDGTLWAILTLMLDEHGDPRESDTFYAPIETVHTSPLGAPALAASVAYDAAFDSPNGHIFYGWLTDGESFTLLGRTKTRVFLQRADGSIGSTLYRDVLPSPETEAFSALHTPEGYLTSPTDIVQAEADLDALLAGRSAITLPLEERLEYSRLVMLLDLGFEQYIAPEEGDLSQPAAEDLAWETFVELCGVDAGQRSDYTALSATVLRNGVRAWDVYFSFANAMDPFASFFVSMDAKTATTLSTTQPSDWHETLLFSISLTRLHQEREKREAQWGDFERWTTAQKAELVPFSTQYDTFERYGVPAEGELTDEDAIALARECLIQNVGLTGEVVDGFVPNVFYYITTEDDPLPYQNNTFLVSFHLPPDDEGVYAWQYDVRLDAVTGEVYDIGTLDSGNG